VRYGYAVHYFLLIDCMCSMYILLLVEVEDVVDEVEAGVIEAVEY